MIQVILGHWSWSRSHTLQLHSHYKCQNMFRLNNVSKAQIVILDVDEHAF